MKMQIPTTNQKTKSIRSRSWDAEAGSQAGASASVRPPAAATSAKKTSGTRVPRRIRRRRAYSKPMHNAHPNWAQRRCISDPLQPRRNGNGSWSRNLPDRCWCHPDVRGQRPHKRREPRHDRLDPDGGRRSGNPAVADFLVDVGRPRILVVGPPPHHVRRRRTAVLSTKGDEHLNDRGRLRPPSFVRLFVEEVRPRRGQPATPQNRSAETASA